MEPKLQFNTKNILTRNPRLGTPTMVENFIKQNSGEYKKTELFNRLPKKMMWGTFNVVLEYLWNNNRIGIDKKGFLVYIWNPDIAKKFINSRRY